MERLKEYFDIHEIDTKFDGNYSNLQTLEEQLVDDNRILSFCETGKNSMIAISESTYKQAGDYIRICKMANSFQLKGGFNLPIKQFDEFVDALVEARDNLKKDGTIK